MRNKPNLHTKVETSSGKAHSGKAGLWTTLILVFFLFTGCSAGWGPPSYERLTYPELPQIKVPEIETFTLENGIRFYLVEDHELPMINIRVLVRTGEVLVDDEKAGLAELVARVMRTGGTKTYPSYKLNLLLENNAAKLDSEIDISSGRVSLDMMSEDLDELLPVLVDVLCNPQFPQEKLRLLKTKIRTRISRRNDDQSEIAIREFKRLIYGRESVYGRLVEYRTLENITRQDLLAFHKRSFKGPNMMVGVVGDFDTGDIKEKLKKAFSGIPGGKKTDLPFPKVDYEYQSSVNLIPKSDVNQSLVLMGHIGSFRRNPDFPALQVMNKVLSGVFSGRLFRKVRTEKGLAYAVYGRFGCKAFYPGVFFTGVRTKSSTTAEAIDAVMEEIRGLQQEPVSKEELESAKDQFLNSLVFRFDTREEILQRRMYYEYRGMDKDSFQKLVEEIKEVTAKDIHRVANTYLRPEKMHILVVGNKDQIGDQLEKYGEVREIDISIPQGKGPETPSSALPPSG